jgi:predicted DNA binding CopG/RHH family protein
MSERKTSQIITRVTEDDRAWVDQEASKRGIGTSGFIRMTLRQVRAASVQPSPQHEAA